MKLKLYIDLVIAAFDVFSYSLNIFNICFLLLVKPLCAYIRFTLCFLLNFNIVHFVHFGYKKQLRLYTLLIENSVYSTLCFRFPLETLFYGNNNRL